MRPTALIASCLLLLLPVACSFDERGLDEEWDPGVVDPLPPGTLLQPANLATGSGHQADSPLQPNAPPGAAGSSAAGDEVLICHLPSGDEEKAHEILVEPSAVDAHLEHGDYPGPCH